MLFVQDPYGNALLTFHNAAFALGCSVRDIKALVKAGKLQCFNFGHDKDRILMTSSRVRMTAIKRMLIAEILTSLDGAIATADERQGQRELEAARQRSLAWKAEWERRHTGEAYYDPDGQWYVYTLSTPSDRIFYGGKGRGPRVHQHEQEAKKGHACHKCHTIRKVWRNGGQIKKAIVFRSHSEQAAYDYESTLIARIGLRRLTNVVPGGGAAVSPGPKRSDAFINLAEYRYYLTLRGLKKRELEKVIRDRMQDKIGILQDRVYKLRRYNYGHASREKTAQELEQEILGLQATIGEFDQLSFW